MFRIANLVVVVALLVTAAVVYQVKYASMADAERLAHLRQAIRVERDAIAVMRAEWARRTSPLYIQGLVQRHLDLQPLEVAAISTLDDLPEKPASNSDRLGGMIEALVDAPLTTSSTGRAGTPGSTSTATTPPAPASGGAAVLPATTTLRPANAPTARPAPSVPAPARTPAPAPAPPPARYVPPQAAVPPAAPPAPQNPIASALESILPPGLLPGGR